MGGGGGCVRRNLSEQDFYLFKKKNVYTNFSRFFQQNIGLECPFKSHEYLCFYSQVMNFLYYANDSHFVYEYRSRSHYFPFFCIYANLKEFIHALRLCSVKLEVNLNKETANVGLDSSVGRAPARQSGGRRFKSRSSQFSLFIQIYLKSVPSQFPLWFIT